MSKTAKKEEVKKQDKDMVVDAVLETKEAEQPEVVKDKEEPEIKVGYVVGVTEDGNFAFKVLGTAPTLLEVLGLHEHASHKVKLLYTQNQGGGDSLVLELGKLVTELDQKVNVILEKVAPSKPDNQL